jgi:FMN reductase (NADPH)
VNSTIETMMQHVSVRNFSATPLTKETKETLVRAAQSGSSSNFVQAYTLLDITDSAIRNELADISTCPAYVKKSGAFFMFIADLYRHATILESAGKPLDNIRTMESLIVAIVDTTIAAQSFVTAAESMGLGICYIGGIRNNMKRVAELLDLPPYTVPLFGMTVGKPVTRNEVKPRLPLKNVLGENTYNREQMTDMTEYDKITKAYYSSRQTNATNTTFSQKMVNFFKDVRRPDVGNFLKQQGFILK